ncbi:hypothetical protein [Thiorhodovibrio frisius]|uniref:Uncharacterized protein n=1 Tax=Thiorhodovibrio frisius TaxID=631362 RepID=H8YY74_9GAMM|nr:hypothetical protein [Thiorhodovibrio frisius]EIC23400.1 hypothetical protein Thi970DRAFT_01064 [Thiorhodovibrio frisius]WPL23519.1 hypothetical protein Thiofri_03709 [Thiorhodovibrio frisius]
MNLPIARTLPDEEIRDAIRAAFSPLECSINTQDDYGTKVSFVVHLPNGKNFPFQPGQNTSRVDTASQLNVILTEARRRIEDMGFVLDHWAYIER